MRILAVTNCYPTVERPAQGTFIEQQIKSLRHAGLTVEVLTLDRANLGYSAYRGLGRRVQAEAAKHDADLVHVMYGGVMATAVVRAIQDRAVMVSFCGSDLLGENLPGLLRKVAITSGVWCSRFAARRASGVVVKSKNLFRALPRGLNQKRVRIIPNGVDTQRFRPMDARECRHRLGWKEGAFHVLFPSNNGSPVKRLWLAQAAVKTTKALGLPTVLHPLQGIRHDDVPIWLNASDCLILTSEHEGSPNIVKEALACNRPVVSVDVGDVAERIENIAGCYLSAPSPEALGQCLVNVFHGQRQVNAWPLTTELSLEKTAAKLIQFYSEVLEERCPGIAH